MPARLTVLSGPSGVGKGTVVGRLRNLAPGVWVSVSCTTRRPRPGERHGESYFFVDGPEFERMAADGELLEWATFAGNRYGTPRAAVEQHLADGVPTLLEIDLEGARQVRSRMPDAHFVFLSPPSADELVRRIEGRGTESAEDVAARLARAEVEMAAAAEFDEVIVNHDVEAAAREVARVLAG